MTTKTTSEELQTQTEWDNWIAALHEEMKIQNFPFGQEYDPEHYREWFEDGFSPQQAIDEELPYA